MTLPFHFVWHDGTCSEDLAALLADFLARPDEARWHCERGHLVQALGNQGYPALVARLGTAPVHALLAERLAVLLDAMPAAGEFLYSDRVFRKGSAALTKAAERNFADRKEATRSFVRKKAAGGGASSTS